MYIVKGEKSPYYGCVPTSFIPGYTINGHQPLKYEMSCRTRVSLKIYGNFISDRAVLIFVNFIGGPDQISGNFRS